MRIISLCMTFVNDCLMAAAGVYDGSLPQALDLEWEACDVLHASVPSETLSLLNTDCIGRVASKTVCSSVAIPTTPTSARDGFAVFASKNPCDRSVPVFTRQALPEGFDCVIPVEWSKQEARERAKPGLFISPVGSLVSQGTVLQHSGQFITPTSYALMKQAGITTVSVVRKLTIAILTITDDPEMVYPGSASLAAGILSRSALGITTIDFGVCPAQKDPKGLRDGLLRAVFGQAVDGVVCIGGVWSGDPALDALNELPGCTWNEVFKHTRLGPGKPTSFGYLDVSDSGKKIPVWLLGSAVDGAECGMYAVVVPGIEALMGLPHVMFGSSTTVMRLQITETAKWNGKGTGDDADWVQMLPALASVRDGIVTEIISGPAKRKAEQSTGLFPMHAQKSGLVVVPYGVKSCNPGDFVSVIITN